MFIIIIIIMSLDFKKGVFLLHTSLFCNILALLLLKTFDRLIYLCLVPICILYGR